MFVELNVKAADCEKIGSKQTQFGQANEIWCDLYVIILVLDRIFWNECQQVLMLYTLCIMFLVTFYQ
jgi:hypothetical protein